MYEATNASIESLRCRMMMNQVATIDCHKSVCPIIEMSSGSGANAHLT